MKKVPFERMLVPRRYTRQIITFAYGCFCTDGTVVFDTFT